MAHFRVRERVVMTGQTETEAEPDYRRKYQNLKRKLKFLVYEQECFQEELRKAQRRLLKISRDKSFLLDRLLQYENVDDESSDSGATASSENSECEGPKPLDTPVLKKKRSPQLGGSASPSPSSLSLQATLAYSHSQTPTPTQSPYLSSMTSPTFSPFPSEYLSSYPNTHAPGATAAGGASSAKPDKIKREKRAKAQKSKRAKLRVPLHSSHPESVTMSFSSPSDPLSTLSSKLPPTTILSTVPHQMFSDTGEGSDDDAMEGDDDLVIDIPE